VVVTPNKRTTARRRRFCGASGFCISKIVIGRMCEGKCHLGGVTWEERRRAAGLPNGVAENGQAIARRLHERRQAPGLHLGGVEVWRGGLGGANRLPTLSSIGASLAPPYFRFHTPLNRTGRADLPHLDLGGNVTMSPTRNGVSAW
jgi:hypothetical protein